MWLGGECLFGVSWLEVGGLSVVLPEPGLGDSLGALAVLELMPWPPRLYLFIFRAFPYSFWGSPHFLHEVLTLEESPVPSLLFPLGDGDSIYIQVSFL